MHSKPNCNKQIHDKPLAVHWEWNQQATCNAQT